jgi:hypothetical protein
MSKKLSYLIAFFLIGILCVPLYAYADGGLHVKSKRYNFYSKIHTYKQLKQKLKNYAKRTKRVDVEHYRLEIGPLILADRNGDGVSDNGGLVAIDEDEVIKIMNTVPGNADPDHPNFQWNGLQRFGLSTMGREILAARIGNPNGTRVLVITQQHGNEFTGTEAALEVLHYLTKNKRPAVQKILDNINLLVIVRANPDGGEPDPDRCVLPTDVLDGVVRGGSPFINSEDGSLTSDCAFYRLNVDPRASMTTLIDTGAIFGYFGHGFDLNRYQYIAFDQRGHSQFGKSIYPVEAQAMVAVARTFKPEVIWDMHNNNEQIVCDENGVEIPKEQSLWLYSAFSGYLPKAKCVGDEKLVNTTIDVVEEGGNDAMRLGAHLINALEERKFGSASRFSQTDSSIPPDSGTLGPSYGTYEYANGSTPVFAGTHEVAAVNKFSFSLQTNTKHQIPFMLGGEFLPRVEARIALHKRGLKALLRSVANGFFDHGDPGDGGWDDIPQPEIFLGAFNSQFVDVISDPWFYIVFGYLSDEDLAKEPYVQALAPFLAQYDIPSDYVSCFILSDYGLCKSILDSNPSNSQEAEAWFQAEWRYGIPDMYFHNPQPFAIDSLY